MITQKTILFLILLLFRIDFIGAQDISFQKEIGGSKIEKGNCVKQTIDSGYIIIANTNSFGAGKDDIYLIKTNANGDTIWTKTYGGSNYEGGSNIQQTFDGGYILAGYSNSFSSGNNNMYLIKTKINGDTSWTKVIGGLYESFGNYVQQTIDSGYIATGGFGSNSISDFYLVKTNKTGDTLWTKTYKGLYTDSKCSGKSVLQTSDGGFIISGQESNNNQSIRYGWLIKVNSNGIMLWKKNYSGRNYAGFNSMALTGDGGYMMVGNTQAVTTGIDESLLLIRTDSIGDTLWTKYYGGAGPTYGSISSGNSINPTIDGGYIISAETDSMGTAYWLWALKINNAGDTLWTKLINTNHGYGGSYIQQTSDSGYILTGGFKITGLNYDVLLVKMDSLGYYISTGISDTQSPATTVVIYPNPTIEHLYIDFTNWNKAAFISLYDIAGQILVNKQTLFNRINTLQISPFAQGIYFYQIFSGNEVLKSGKIVIQK